MSREVIYSTDEPINSFGNSVFPNLPADNDSVRPKSLIQIYPGQKRLAVIVLFGNCIFGVIDAYSRRGAN